MSDETTNTSETASKQPSFEALRPLIDAGFELIPLHHVEAVRELRGRIVRTGKLPLRRGWEKGAILSLDEARELMGRGHNIGVRLRPTDLVVDVDPRNFEDGDDPVGRLQADLAIRLDDWPTVVTGSGGHHHYMAIPADAHPLVNGLKAYPGVEFKSHPAGGRQMVAPGSVHPETGGLYTVDPLSDGFGTVPAAPDALLNLIRRPEGSAAAEEPGELTSEQVGALLEELDPRDYADHDAWLELMMACHHGSAGEAVDEFVAWSTSDPAYAHEEDIIRRRWSSLHADAGGRRITLRTLLKRLNEVGRGELADALTRSDPLDDFPDDLDDLPDFIGEQEAKATLLDRVNADRFTVLTGGRYLVGRERTDPRTGVFSVEWYSPDAVKQHMNVKSVETPEGKRVPLGTWWIGHPQRRQYDGVVFDPTPGASHPDLYNLWRGWAVEPKKGDWSKMQGLIRDVLCRGDQASYDYVVRWMAHMVQSPSRPAEVALVFKGRKGTGKGTLCRALKELAGPHGRHVTSPEHFTGRFNEHLADTILLFVDEGFWAGDKRAEGQLKGLITEKSLTFEGKGKPIVEGPNQLHVVMASNEDWVVPATHDERRFAVFEADDAAARAFPHFAVLNEDEGDAERQHILAAMLHDLLAMDLGGWHPRRDVPQTGALLDQKLEGLRKSPLDAWWYDCLEAGEVSELVGSKEHWPKAWEADPSTKELLLMSLRASHRDAAGISKTRLAQYLGGVGVGVGDRVRNKQNQKVWAVPSLDDARRAFEAKMGGSIDWAD
ncbi:DUF5906 domain-containing protein [Sphingosinicella humi]|uniref:DUF5906 domain-containing protein n=1 Tax=Allosphingosinicella humi TaxID=2068657 RepID=UPI001304FDAC|nr:DUF5906 domain-containing protein [Sphingosinicella humi]